MTQRSVIQNLNELLRRKFPHLTTVLIHEIEGTGAVVEESYYVFIDTLLEKEYKDLSHMVRDLRQICLGEDFSFKTEIDYFKKLDELSIEDFEQGWENER